MHKLLVLYPEPTDRTAFTAYYEGTHLPLAASLPGMVAWRYSLDVHAEGESPYFAVFEADFPDAATLGAAMRSPQGQAVAADVPNYATGGAVVIDYPVVETKTSV
ncbi:ethyl tert-butyl ether degradation protein EthD [Enemella evansiae]|nr:EthD family reductase [Enemella evansiae]OYN96205.1 ethyl tert-butyl ether degradation protein EthD [Enemella evansiae]OYN99576.1 ethyl tert-butyl ether degradation protein EthD [Enemella evansiae]